MLQIKRRFYKQCLRFFEVCRKPRFWLLIVLFIVAFLVTVGPLNVLFNQDFLVEHLQAYQCCAIALFIFLYIILTIIGIPGTILSIAGGLVFGLVWGTIWSAVGATLGALGAFWTARYLFRDFAEEKFGKYRILSYLQKMVKDNPLQFVLTLRLAPITPFNFINFLFGLTSIHWFPYTIATFFGIVPGTFAYTWLGVSGGKAIAGDDQLPFILALSFLAFLSILPICFRKK